MNEQQILKMGFIKNIRFVYFIGNVAYPVPGITTYSKPYISIKLFNNSCKIEIETLDTKILKNGDVKFKGNCKSKSEFKRIVNIDKI